MADLNYVSPLTSDLTDYYTKTEVDELQQGDENRFATQAQITAGDNEVKGWVASQGYLTQHQSLQNYATKEYVDDAIEGIDGGGMRIRVVNVLPAEGEEGIFYLVYENNDEEENRYAEYIWSDTLNGYEMLGYGTGEGVLPDLTDYATKQWVEAKGYLDSSDLIGYATVSDLADFATKDYVDDELANKADSATLAAVATSGDYEDLINKPTIPSLTGYATQTYVNDAVAAIDIPDVSDFITAEDLPDVSDMATETWVQNQGYLTQHQDISGKANAADLAAVATTGSYNDLSNKPTIPSTSGLASETYVDNAIAAIDIPTKVSDLDNDMNFVDEPMASAKAIDEINNLVSAAGLSGSYNDLDDKPVIPTVPTNVSSFTNDAGYLTSHQDISGKVDGTVVSGTTTAKIFNEADGGGAQIITASARGFAGVHDGSNPDATYATMYVKNAAGTSTLARVDLDGDGKAYYLKNGASKADGSEIAVKGDIPDVSSFITSSDLPDLSGYAETSNLATVATSGDYDDLTNKPTIPSISGLATETYVDNAVAGISVPANTSDLTNDSGFITSADLPDTSGFVESSDLATVATTGDYDDLTNKPTIPVLPTLATVATSGSYNDLTDKPVAPGSVEIYHSLAGYLLGVLLNENIFANHIRTSDKSVLLDYLNKGYGVWPTDTINISYGDFNNGDSGNLVRIRIRNNNGTYSISNGASNGHSVGISTLVFKVQNNTIIVIEVNKSGGNVSSNDFKDTLNTFLKNYFLTYSNTTSGLTATTFQEAIDELAQASGSSSGITVQDVIDEFNDNGLTIDNGNDSKVEITNDGVLQTAYDSNDNVLIEQYLDARTAYERGTDNGVDWEVQTYDTIDETGLGFGKTVSEDGTTTNEMSLIIRPSRDYDAIEVNMTDMVNDYSDTKTIAFVEDLPSAVQWTYDSSTGYMTFTGMSEDER